MKINTKLTCWRKCFRKYPSNDKKKKKEEEEEDKKKKEKKRKEKKIARLLFWHFARIFFSQEVRVKSPSLRFYFRRSFRQ